MNDIKNKLENAEKKYVGLKQFYRAFVEEDVIGVVLAMDVDKQLKNAVKAKCLEKNIPIYFVPKKSDLGKWVNIDVDASIVTML